MNGNSKRGKGIQRLIAVLRPFYRHRIVGAERFLTSDEPCVFVCNHGEIYGPVATVLYVPFDFRPWVTCEMTDARLMGDYLYENNVKRMKWLPDRIGKWAVQRVIAPLMAWVMGSLRAIPVYHGNPRGLMKTFRETVEALEMGEHILLFPENSAMSQTGRFVREGASAFFTGFVTIGMLYHHKTGKKLCFIPVYADRKKRTITFGKEVRYDPDGADEKERLCRELRGQMLHMAGQYSA